MSEGVNEWFLKFPMQKSAIHRYITADCRFHLGPLILFMLVWS